MLFSRNVVKINVPKTCILYICFILMSLCSTVRNTAEMHDWARCVEAVFGHVSGLGASLFIVKPLWQRRKLLNWLGIGLSETDSCNNVKVVKPPGIFKELSAATQGERQRRGRRRERLKEPENNIESGESLFSARPRERRRWKRWRKDISLG